MNIVTVTFNGRLRHGEEQLLRGAFVKALGQEAGTLFHNHEDEGLRYAYPLVQYKIVGGRPAVVALDEATGPLLHLPQQLRLTIGHREREFAVAGVETQDYWPQIDDAPKMYALTRYLPLNTSNCEQFDSLPALTDRVCLVEDIINANILAFFKGIGYHCGQPLQTAISQVDHRYEQHYKGVRFRAFDLRFISNALLPQHIGLGKSSSVGFGTLRRLEVPQNYLDRLTPSHS